MNLTRRQLAAVAAAPLLRAQANPARKRRAECFFGLHFDLHPNPSDPALGLDVNDTLVEKIIRLTRPDYIQYDSKGHAGWLGWPSQVGPSAPHIVNDSLAVYRRVTAKHGVALFIHFSGVWDGQAVERHPEWARLDEKGERDKRNASTFGPYVDELMIPQLREAASKYDLDGVWVDGECWSVYPDFHPRAIEEFRRRTGLQSPPKDNKGEGWRVWLDIQRESFRSYAKHYLDEVHRTHPKFQIASNWLYSTFVPERPELPVDFISGDYLGNASISTARLEARYMSQTGKPWDLMAWGFQQAQSNRIGHIHKPAVQLMQEASVVIAQGGGFQVYYQPSRTGHFEDSHLQVMSKVAAFCREREARSHKSEAVPQIGVVFSKETLYDVKCFGGWGGQLDPARGLIDALVANQWSVDVLPDWKLAEMLPRYPLVVLPEWRSPGETVLNALWQRAQSGGKLLVAGVENTAWFAQKLGGRVSMPPAETPAFAAGGEAIMNLKGVWQELAIPGALPLSTRHKGMDTTRDGVPLALAVKSGQGELILVPGPLGHIHVQTHAPQLRDILRGWIAPRFTPLVQVEAPPVIEVSLRRKHGKLYAHLLNSTNMQVAGDFAAFDYIAPAGPVRLRYQGGTKTLPSVHIHEIVELPV